MSCIVLRTCTETPEDDTGREGPPRSHGLADYRDTPAYVLLGDPGSGKTTAFDAERNALGENACLVTARDFLAFEPGRHPEWRGRTLFIDGLDEVRAGGGDARTPLDALRGRLDALGTRRFRLSCREADWLGANDRTHLAKVSRNGLVLLRLDPLTDDDIARILSARAGIDDPASFVEAAKQRGVDSFLANPQSLNMLADVVADGGGWPASRAELFEEACRRMLQEQNEEHILAVEDSSLPAVAPEDLLDAAGRLCAVLLISGIAGYALERRLEDDSHPALDRCGPEYPAPGRRVVATRLFAAAAGGRRFRPVHRHFAEFLGARYLAGLVQGEGRRGTARRCGVPARRILALMTGHDGGIFTELRGLAAWLAAQCPVVRSELIERDPIGVACYGDAGRLSPGERVALLKSLGHRTGAVAEWLEQSLLDPARAGFPAGSLFAPDTAGLLRDVLADPRRDKAQQTLALFILRGLAHGTALAGMADALLDVVRDDSRWPGVRRRALSAYLRNERGQADFNASLKLVLADLSARRTSEPEDALLGTLLSELYPGGLSASEVWEFLLESDASVGEYFSFWKAHVVNESPVEDLPIHLDVLTARRDELQAALNSRGLQDLPADLLARALEAHGDDLEPGRLYDWLGAGLGVDPCGDGVRRIRAWLEQRPAAQRAVQTEGVARCMALDDSAFRDSAAGIGRRLHGARQPDGFGAWCVEQAEAWADRDRRVVAYFLRQVWHAAHGEGQPSEISLHTLAKRARAHAVLNETYRQIRESDRQARLEIERHEREHEHYRDAEERRHEEWLDWVRRDEAALRDNRGAPALLRQLALAYFGLLIGAEGDDPWSRLRTLLRGDGRLEEAVLRALGEAIRRDDLPDVGEIVRLRDENQEHVLALPALASLEEIFRVAPSDVDELGSEQLCRALAFHYCTTGMHEPPWYGRVVRIHPTVAADVLVRTAAPALRTTQRVAGVHELARRSDHREVAKHASLPLLRAFPTRGNAEHVDLLDSLLWSALRYAERDSLRHLIDEKAGRRSTNVIQRARWLAAGCVARPNRYLKRLERFVGDHESRAGHVAAFFDVGASAVWEAQTSDNSWRNSVAGHLVEEMGANAIDVLVRITGQVRAAHAGVSRLIRCLADLRDGEASRALEALASDAALHDWRDELVRARDDQRVLCRDAHRGQITVEEACRTLDDGPPANAADLAALTADRLDEIARAIRTDNANGWRPFWNEDARSRATTPKHEESCRDVLLTELRHWLPDDVDVQPEGRYANDKRADLRIAYRDFQIPVEIKKNGHPRLWSTVRDQLIARYTRDPATDGYGIYLVLWFGEAPGRGTPPPAIGTRPAGPDALRRRLKEELPPEEARKIAVCVIDVNAPAVSPVNGP